MASQKRGVVVGTLGGIIGMATFLVIHILWMIKSTPIPHRTIFTGNDIHRGVMTNSPRVFKNRNETATIDGSTLPQDCVEEQLC